MINTDNDVTIAYGDEEVPDIWPTSDTFPAENTANQSGMVVR